jgi:hypothetical protein
MEASAIPRRAGFSVLAALMTVGVLASLLSFPLVASAAAFQVELEKQVIRGAAGDRIDLGTSDVPESFVGLTCTVAAMGNNNESVHVGNNIEITSVNTVTLVGVEDSRNKDTFADGPLTLADTVSFTLVLGPDPVYSAELSVTFDCPDQETTTTTVVETTTTTTPETTTTVAETTTTTVDVTTTSTTTPETTTTAPESTTTTVQVAPTTTPSTTPATLPFTGDESEDLAIVALVALLAGGALVLTTRRSAEVTG